QIVIGQYLKEDAEPIAIVAGLSKIWIVSQVKEKDIYHIRAMDQVEVQVSGIPGKSISGKIFHINEMVDEDTRSVEILIECDNTDRTLKPGMYATVHYKDVPIQSIIIPSKAIFQQEENQYVFVQIEKNKYQKRKVETADTTDSNVVILSGLENGEIIVNDGGIYLIKEQ
ncbi:efflux RND transporter periplasmic adaptor subunit, partial [Brucella sp. 21LCYQ03]|nr:efflux RND transporter periplasmic adaptor subunit [Brucella sp. 21LCYQ03]